MNRRCYNCKHYTSETLTPTGIGIGYCYHKESKRYGLPDGSIQTVTYADSTCKYFEVQEDVDQITFILERR